jgi:hypothetical protein
VQRDKLQVFRNKYLLCTYIGKDHIRREIESIKLIAKSGYQLKYNGKAITYRSLIKEVL